MRLKSVTLSGFRCFDPDPITVPISPEITAVVGRTKTATLNDLLSKAGVQSVRVT